MSDFLTTLAARSAGKATQVMPRPPARFEEPAPLAPTAFDEIVTEAPGDQPTHPTTARRSLADPATLPFEMASPPHPTAGPESVEVSPPDGAPPGHVSRHGADLAPSGEQAPEPGPSLPPRRSPSPVHVLDEPKGEPESVRHQPQPAGAGDPPLVPDPVVRLVANPVTAAPAPTTNPPAGHSGSAPATTPTEPAPAAAPIVSSRAEPVPAIVARLPLAPPSVAVVPTVTSLAPIPQPEPPVAVPRNAPPPPDPVIQVTIGRVEVRGVAAPTVVRRTAEPPSGMLPLNDYLARRRGGG